MRSLSILNSLWDGQGLSIERRTSESLRLDAARLTLGVQEKTLAGFDGERPVTGLKLRLIRR